MISLECLLTKHGYGMARIDAEVRNGNLTMVMKGGKTYYIPRNPLSNPVEERRKEPAVEIGRHISKKTW